MRAVVYEITREELLNYKVDSTDVNLIFEVFGIRTMLSTLEYGSKEIFFIHVKLDEDSQAKDLFISPIKRFDYELAIMKKEATDLHKRRVTINEKEDEMFKNYKPIDVKLKKLEGVDLTQGIKRFNELKVNAEITYEGDVPYLIIDDDDPIDITSDTFLEVVKQYILRSQTVSGLDRDAVMYSAIQSLKLIEEINLKPVSKSRWKL